MIKQVYPTGKYTIVSGRGAPHTYAGMPPSAPATGNVRFNSSNQYFEAYDGTSWIPIQQGVAGVGLTPAAETILDWAYKKMTEEAELDRLSHDHPAISAAVANLNKAKEQLKATIILSKEHEKNPG
jgi:hypothetical protein